MFCSWQSQMVKSTNTYYKLADVQQQVIRTYHVTSLRPIMHEGLFYCCSPSSSGIRPALILLHLSITVNQREQCVSIMSDKYSKK
jgi:hypothetical protein